MFKDHASCPLNLSEQLLNQLNFEFIAPSEALNNYQHNMKFRNTMGFAEVEEVEQK